MNEFTPQDAALLQKLGVSAPPKQRAAHTQRETRIIAGFEDIQRFVRETGRLPQPAAERDIFERILAVRLFRLRAREECRTLLQLLDTQALLTAAAHPASAAPDAPDAMNDAAVLEELGVSPDAAPPDADSDAITQLVHVRSTAEKRAAEEIADRRPCRNFVQFKSLFETTAEEIQSGVRKTRPIRKEAGFSKTEIQPGGFFILNGQTIFVAEVGEAFKAPNGDPDARLRVIYSNATESNILLRSLQRALYKDNASRLVSEPGAAGPLFSSEVEEGDLPSGTIYVLRSKSKEPKVARHRDILHKIGVTGGDIKKRIANAAHDPTFLLADVELVETYELFNIDRIKMENLIHRFFAAARFDIEIKDRFGQPVSPREWFLVPLSAVDAMVEKIKDGTIEQYAYDPASASLTKKS